VRSGLSGLRIGLVGPIPPPAGGMAMQTQQLAELLQGAQAHVVTVPTNSPYRPAWVARIRGMRALFRLVPYLAALWRTAGRCDVVHVMANSGWSWHLFAAPAIWTAHLRRVPVIVNYRGGEAADFMQRSARAVGVTMRRASCLVVPSEFLQEVFARHHFGCKVVPNIVDLARFRPGDPTQPRQIIVARNLEAIYDNATALRAFAQVHAVYPDVRLLLAGTGPQESMLRAMAGDLGVASVVEFAGRLDRETMASRLRDSCVALNPSLVDNMPNSVLEALASGVPVVSTCVGGVPFIVQDEHTALLVPPQQPDAMAAAILRLLGEPAVAVKLREAGLVAVRAYTWSAVAPQWQAAYAAVIGKAEG